tara:strand:- start:1353 stop:1586 length:234 start_codon:yes stop_codon:yes gene_type:complete
MFMKRTLKKISSFFTTPWKVQRAVADIEAELEKDNPCVNTLESSLNLLKQHRSHSQRYYNGCELANLKTQISRLKPV